MNTAKIYHDSDGEERTILQMVTLEKEWAANRIQEGEKAIEKSAELTNILEDVVDELDLSEGMVEKHGPLGTAPAELVRLVLERKDEEISMLKRGFVSV